MARVDGFASGGDRGACSNAGTSGGGDRGARPGSVLSSTRRCVSAPTVSVTCTICATRSSSTRPVARDSSARASIRVESAVSGVCAGSAGTVGAAGGAATGARLDGRTSGSSGSGSGSGIMARFGDAATGMGRTAPARCAACACTMACGGNGGSVARRGMAAPRHVAAAVAAVTSLVQSRRERGRGRNTAVYQNSCTLSAAIPLVTRAARPLHPICKRSLADEMQTFWRDASRVWEISHFRQQNL